MGQLLDIIGMYRHFFFGSFACLGPHQFTNTGPIFKFGRGNAVHQGNAAINGARPSTSKLQCLVHFLAIVHDDEKHRLFFLRLSHALSFNQTFLSTCFNTPGLCRYLGR